MYHNAHIDNPLKSSEEENPPFQSAHEVFIYPNEYLSYGAEGLANITTQRNGRKEYSVFDHLGSVRVRLDEEGDIISYYDYEPFGKQMSTSVTPRLSFIDKEKDKESNLRDFGVRKYDDYIGRFTSIDPLFDKYYSLTPYHYSLNDPINTKDNNGLYAWVVNKNLPESYSYSDGNLTSPKSFDVGKLQYQLNNFANIWNNSEQTNRHYAPLIANYLIQNEIRIGIYEMDEGYGGTTAGIGSKDIAIPEHVFRNKYPDKYNLESSFFEELVHSIGYGEFNAKAAAFAAGYYSKDRIMKDMYKNYGFKKFTKDMPSEFGQFFYNNGALKPELENKFWDSYYNLGKTITGQMK